MRKMAILIALLGCMSLCVVSEARALTIYTPALFDDVLEIGQKAYSWYWLRDADGDGIPNGDDEDWVPPLDGTGYGAPEKSSNIKEIDAGTVVLTPSRESS
jgi:hypothetical protein